MKQGITEVTLSLLFHLLAMKRGNICRKVVDSELDLKGYMGRLNCLISVYGADGTISVATSGIEMGQGLNTKVRYFQ